MTTEMMMTIDCDIVPTALHGEYPPALNRARTPKARHSDSFNRATVEAYLDSHLAQHVRPSRLSMTTQALPKTSSGILDRRRAARLLEISGYEYGDIR
jgi:acyl-CoA synthetase (AMP-forming)/AMP-acid ligase II